MSDSVERAAEIDAPLQQLKHKIDAEPAARSGGGFAAGLSLMLVLALACGVGAAGYWLWPQWQSLQAQSKEMQQDQQRLTEQNTLLQEYQRQQQQQLQTEQQQRLQQLEQRLQDQQQQLAQQTLAQVQAVRQLVQERDSAPPRHWLLAEIEYLLKLASQKVWLEHDTATALALLASADEKLAQLDDPSLVLVREAIAADSEQLSRIVRPDLSKVHVQLQQLRKLSNALPLKQQQAELAPELAPSNELANWRETLSYYWQQSWSKLVQVRTAMPEDYFELSADQQLMLRMSLNQQLLLAELAAMQNQNQVYGAALQQASDQLQRYFDAADPMVQQVSTELANLAAVQVALPQAEALKSLPQLQQYQQQLTETEL